MNEMQNKLTKLLEDDQALREKIYQQETLDAAYTVAESVLPGLTVEEFRDWARTAFADGQTLTDEQLEEVAGGKGIWGWAGPPRWQPFV